MFSESDNHKHSFKKLFAVIRDNAKTLNAISEADIQKWEASLIAMKGITGELTIQRDKVYAHTDVNSDEIRNEVSVTDTQASIDLMKDMLNEIRIILSEPPYDFILLQEPTTSLKHIVKALIERDEHLRMIELNPHLYT